jgi:uncharacterized protein (DUF58 family)
MKTALFHAMAALAHRRRHSSVLWRAARSDYQVTIELKEPLPVVAFVLLLVWYAAAPTAVSLMVMTALGGTLLAALYWARTMALRVRGRRTLQYLAIQVGDEIEEIVRLENNSSLPVLWAEFVDRSDLPGYTVGGVSATDANNTFEWRAHSTCSRRGVFVLGPWELRLGDPFGFFLIRQTYSERMEILVHPSLAALPSHLLPRGGVLGEHRPHRGPLSADSNLAFSTRPFTQGDPLRHIHWRTTAHHDSPFVKVFEPEAASIVWLVPDCDAGVHLGETEETMVTLAASLAATLLGEQLAVGLMVHTERFEVIPPQHGTSHLWTLMRALAPLHSLPARPLAQTLARANPIVSFSDSVVVITPAVGAGWVRELKRITWNRRGGGAEAILLDPASFGGPGRIEPCISLLAELGLAYKVVKRGEVRPISGAYGALSRWEFKTLATGGIFFKPSPRRAATLAAQLNALSGHARENG